MATSARSSSDFYSTALENYLVAVARTVEGCVNRSFAALLSRNADIASAVFVTEPKINESEILIDEQAVRLLQRGDLSRRCSAYRCYSENQQRLGADGRPGRQHLPVCNFALPMFQCGHALRNSVNGSSGEGNGWPLSRRARSSKCYSRV